MSRLVPFAIGIPLFAPAVARAWCFTAEAEAEIEAPYDVVFDVIIDVAAYPDWNAYILSVTPATADLTVVGTEFSIEVDQPFRLLNTISAEEVVSVQLPDGDNASLVYAYDGPLKLLLGSPARIQTFEAIDEDTTYYHTEETFCTVLLPLLPLWSTQEGFEIMTEALSLEASARYGSG